jgi:tetratricopeptide (TPR) repeat protein
MIVKRIAIGIILIISIINCYKLLAFDYNVGQILKSKTVDEKQIISTINQLPYYNPIERIVLFKYKSDSIKDCLELKKYATRLLSTNKNSAQAYFIRAVCNEQSGNNLEALKMIKNALLLDSYNTVYLLSLAIVQLNLGYLNDSQQTINRILELDPNTDNVSIVQEALNNISKMANEK